jgi:LysM repeat protein
MMYRSHVIVLMIAACLGGCSAYTGYAAFDPDNTSALPSTSAPAGGQGSGSQHASASQTDGVRLNSLFTQAARGQSDGAPGTQLLKPVSLASTGDNGDLLSQPSAKETLQPHGRAYLFRGVAGLLYSRGMDSLAERLEHAGIPASVQTYLLWRSTVEDAIRDYRRDPQPITIIGHSMGGDSALAFAERLNTENIPVSLLVTYDPTRIADDVPPNVERYINIYQSSNIMGGGNVVQGSRFHGHYASYNLKDHYEIVHINIEKAEQIQDQLVTKIAQISSTPAAGEGEAVPIHLEVPTDAPIELWDSGLPIKAHAGDTLKSLAATYHVPLWALAEINSVSTRTPLGEDQRIVVPRYLVSMAMPTAITSYAPMGR